MASTSNCMTRCPYDPAPDPPHGLNAPNALDRDAAAEQLGDICRWPGLTQHEAETAVARLLTAAIEDSDDTVRESALNAICNAFECRDLSLHLVAGLAPCLHTMTAPLLEHALGILGSTRNPDACPMIEPYRQHPVDYVREAAVMALADLPAQNAPAVTDRNS
ncbi:HEAT repeat domain-containing protein [Streptomyces zaomyceticus]|uniref:HEAT repeat domain-containing protein n=1 Tax=Streptomyces zaomyceticus TaxID=68286 RepID=UPI003719DA18